MNIDENRAWNLIEIEYLPENADNIWFKSHFKLWIKETGEDSHKYGKPEKLVEEFTVWVKEKYDVTLFKKAQYINQPQS